MRKEFDVDGEKRYVEVPDEWMMTLHFDPYQQALQELVGQHGLELQRMAGVLALVQRGIVRTDLPNVDPKQPEKMDAQTWATLRLMVALPLEATQMLPFEFYEPSENGTGTEAETEE